MKLKITSITIDNGIMTFVCGEMNEKTHLLVKDFSELIIEEIFSPALQATLEKFLDVCAVPQLTIDYDNYKVTIYGIDCKANEVVIKNYSLSDFC